MESMKLVLIKALFFLGFLEIFSFLVLMAGLIPDIYSSRGVIEPSHILNQGVYWRTEKEDWGAWHKVNFIDNHYKSCFKVTYKSNNIGARDDVNYTLEKKFGLGTIVLGDSFIEGIGLRNNATMPKRLQLMTKKFAFNLGSANNVGPLQYLMIYKKFQFLPHDSVVVAFLPSNDFVDNDVDKSNLFGADRYRPYYNVKESSINYPIHYTHSAIKREEIG